MLVSDIWSIIQWSSIALEFCVPFFAPGSSSDDCTGPLNVVNLAIGNRLNIVDFHGTKKTEGGHVWTRHQPAPCVFLFRFSIMFNWTRPIKTLRKKLNTKSPSRPKEERRPWQPPQLPTPRRPGSQTTEHKQTNSMPLVPVNAPSITAVETVAHGADRIEFCWITKNRQL